MVFFLGGGMEGIVISWVRSTNAGNKTGGAMGEGPKQTPIFRCDIEKFVYTEP